MVEVNYNIDELPDSSFELVPQGWYVAQIVKSEIALTKKGTGETLNLTWEISDGLLAGKRLIQRINIANQNPQVQEIGLGELKKVCQACGIKKHFSDSELLHGIPCKIRVTHSVSGGETYANVKQVDAIPRKADAATPKPTDSKSWGTM